MSLESKIRYGLYFAIGCAVIITAMITAVWPVWNLFPHYVTEKVKVASVDSSGCMATTSDNYLVKLIDSCNAKPGDYIMGTYDVKVKKRMKPFIL